MDSIRQIITLPSRAAIAALLRYELRQQGAKHSRRACRATPSCTEYALAAIARQGLLVGGAKGGWRALRCRFRSNGPARELDPLGSDAGS